LLILLTFYYFVSTEVIPRIAETLKARQITENEKIGQKQTTEENFTTIFTISKQESDLAITSINVQTINNE